MRYPLFPRRFHGTMVMKRQVAKDWAKSTTTGAWGVAQSFMRNAVHRIRLGATPRATASCRRPARDGNRFVQYPCANNKCNSKKPRNCKEHWNSLAAITLGCCAVPGEGTLAARQNLDLCCNCAVRIAALKFLLTCLMLVAIPLQGFAGMAAGACGGNHSGVVGSAHSHQSENAAGDHGHASGHAQALKSVGEPVHSKSSACGSCCVAAAIQAEVLATVDQTPQQANFPDLSSHHLSPALGGLDRPPQIARA